MVDRLSEEHRSWNMSQIKGSNTKPEVLVRRIVHGLGFRFTITGPLNKKLPGRPDLVLPKWKTVIFVHGCFWHRHEGCKDATTPKSRTEWWISKLTGNRDRDLRNQTALIEAGWKVIVVWECETTPRMLEILKKRLQLELSSKFKTQKGSLAYRHKRGSNNPPVRD